MNASKVSKVLILAGVGVGSFFAGVLAMNVRGNWAAQEEPGVTKSQVTADTPPIPKPNGRTVLATAASYSIVKPKILFDGEQVVISASASVRETRPNAGYVWAVHVFAAFDVNRQFPLFEHWFEDDLLQVEADEKHFNLRERLPIPLDHGDYQVTVGVYRVPADGGIAALKEEPIRKLFGGMEGASATDIATIGR